MIRNTHHHSRRSVLPGTRIPSRLSTDPRPPGPALEAMVAGQRSEHPVNANPLNGLQRLWTAGIRRLLGDTDPTKVAKPTLAEVLRADKLLTKPLEETKLIKPATHVNIKDLIKVLKTPNLKTPNGDLLSLSVRERDKYTEFFLNIDRVENIPEEIAAQVDKGDSEGIHFVVPNEALPTGGLEHNKDLIKSWLGLPPAVDFDLYPKPTK